MCQRPGDPSSILGHADIDKLHSLLFDNSLPRARCAALRALPRCPCTCCTLSPLLVSSGRLCGCKIQSGCRRRGWRRKRQKSRVAYCRRFAVRCSLRSKASDGYARCEHALVRVWLGAVVYRRLTTITWEWRWHDPAI